MRSLQMSKAVKLHAASSMLHRWLLATRPLEQSTTTFTRPSSKL